MSSQRTRTMDSSEIALRAQHARDYLEAATDTRALHPDRTNVIASNAVLAGIAASDAICGRVLGRRAVGENHKEAATLLGTATTRGPELAKDLRRLLDLKTTSQYSALTLGGTNAEKAVGWAERLVDAMERILRTS